MTCSIAVIFFAKSEWLYCRKSIKSSCTNTGKLVRLYHQWAANLCMQRPIYSCFRDSRAHSADAQSPPFTSSLFLWNIYTGVSGPVNLPVFWANLRRKRFWNKHLHLLYASSFSVANARRRRRMCEHSRRQIRTCMYTQKAFIAGRNNTGLLPRGQPPFCG